MALKNLLVVWRLNSVNFHIFIMEAGNPVLPRPTFRPSASTSFVLDLHIPEIVHINIFKDLDIPIAAVTWQDVLTLVSATGDSGRPPFLHDSGLLCDPKLCLCVLQELDFFTHSDTAGCGSTCIQAARQVYIIRDTGWLCILTPRKLKKGGGWGGGGSKCQLFTFLTSW